MKSLVSATAGWLTAVASIAALAVLILAPEAAEKPFDTSDRARIEALFSHAEPEYLEGPNNSGEWVRQTCYMIEDGVLAEPGNWAVSFCRFEAWPLTKQPPSPKEKA